MDEDLASELKTLELMLQEEKESLEMTLAKEGEGNAALEEQLKQLKEEQAQLSALGEDSKKEKSDGKEKGEEEGGREASSVEELTQEVQELKLKYESQVWERVEAERDTKKLERSIELVKAKLKDSEKARETAELLGGKLAAMKEDVETKVTERIALEKLKITLEGELLLLKQQLVRRSAESAEVSVRLAAETGVLKKKLAARSGIEQVLLHLYKEQTLLTDRLVQETRARSQLELLLDVEVNEVNRRLLVESNAREEMRLQVEQALRVRQSVISDLALLKGKLQLLLERQEAAAEKQMAASGTQAATWNGDGQEEEEASREEKDAAYQDEELSDMVALSQEIDRQLAAVGELVDPSDLEVLTASDAQNKLLDRLSQQVAAQAAGRKALEDRNSSLEASVKSLERQLERERQENAEFRAAMQQEMASLRGASGASPGTSC